MTRNGIAEPPPWRWWVLVMLLVASPQAGRAQQLLPNPDLSNAANGPAEWRLHEGVPTNAGWAGGPDSKGFWVRGNGDDASSWRTESLPLEPGGIYRLHLRGRRDPAATGGTAVAGTRRVNRDFPLASESRDETFAFLHPQDAGPDVVRLGQWHVQGTVRFEQARLFRAMAVHLRSPDGNFELGEAESLRNGTYRFEPDLGWEGANAHRTLVTNRAGFNSNRWLFQPNAEIVYRLGVPPTLQSEATLRVGINHHLGGTLLLEARREGIEEWVELGRFDAQRRNGTLKLPATLFPTASLLVRLRQPDAGAGFQVDTFAYESRLTEAVPDLEGATRFVDVHLAHPQLALEVERLGSNPADGGSAMAWIRLVNRLHEPRRVRVSLNLESGTGDGGTALEVLLPPGRSDRIPLPGPRLPGPGDHPLRLTVATTDGQTLVLAGTRLRSSILDDSHYGETISSTPRLAVWWCDSMRKVGRDRPIPPATATAVSVKLELARGEYEAAQIVLKPERDAQLLAVSVGEFRNPDGTTVDGLTVRWDEVRYVHVTQPTDSTCVRGWYPDPLPPLRAPLRLDGGKNQPLWVTVHAGHATPAGVARAELTLRTDVGEQRVPVEVSVFDFALPRETHLRTAFGLGSGIINQYHRLTLPADREAVFEKYLRNFAEHRISPYSFYDYAPIHVQFVNEPGGTGKVARVDFAAFDAAAERWLGEGGFNTFQLPLRGMGGGTFHSRHLGRLEGHEEGTPEHTRLFGDYLGQIERHLSERGWLSKAFTYWFDEPDPKDYEFVVAGMKRLKQAAPRIRRMLTEQPEPALLGHVDIWCGLTPEWTPAAVQERRNAGEEVWWYICTAPKAPYVTEFIDHPGTELRLWPWQSWQYGVHGLLVWAALYWNSPLAYPEPDRQDPWLDPMSWVSGYGFPIGHKAPWGNGDGRFLYPPLPDPEHSGAAAPIRDGPVNSVRWENLRDGMEDYEYLWLLQQEVARVGALAKYREAAWLAGARGLLVVPDSISRDLTRFTTHPEPIRHHRRAVAAAIAQLRQAR